MARFDLYRPAASTYYVDVQNDHLDDFGRRVVVELRPLAIVPNPIAILHPVIDIDARPFVLATHRIGSLPRRLLGRPVQSLSAHQDDITRALDLLLTGF